MVSLASTVKDKLRAAASGPVSSANGSSSWVRTEGGRASLMDLP